MAFSDGLGEARQFLVRKMLAVWVKVTIKPDDAAAMIAAEPRPVCYVFERESSADLAVLNDACGRLGLPRPGRRLLVAGRRAARAFFFLERRVGLFGLRKDRRAPAFLAELVAAAAAQADFDVEIVPVAVFWGRAAPKEASWWRQLFTDNWAFVGRFRRALTVILNGRNTLLYFGEPLRLRAALQTDVNDARNVRRVTRLLRASLSAQRTSTIGPDLSHRRTIVAQVLRTRAVRRAVADAMRARAASRRTVLLAAKKYADEIAAN